MITRVLILLALCPTLYAVDAAPDKAIGITLGYRDSFVKPGDDFEEYANGGWRKTAEIPANRASTGIGFEVFQKAEQRNADLVKQAAASKPAPKTPQRLIADYYAAFMDTAGIEKRGLAPLKPQLDEIDKIATTTDLARVLGQRLRADVDPINATQMWTENLFGLFVTQAFSEPTHTIPYLLQGGPGLPDRDYYISEKPEMAKIRTAYQTYVGDLLKLAGLSDPSGRAERVMALETKMAGVHADRVTSQNVHKANNPTASADLAKNAPGLDWKTYLYAAGLESQPMFMLWQPEAVKGLSALVGSEELATWKDWLIFHTLNQNVGFLPHAYTDLGFGFYRKTLQGTPQQLDRWKRAIAHVNLDLGDAVGQIYVGKYFPSSSKTEVQGIVQNLLLAFDHRLDGLSWMAPATKTEAKAKLKTLRVGVGYPETWRDYAGLAIQPNDPLGNAERAKEWEYHHQLAKLSHPVDRGE